MVAWVATNTSSAEPKLLGWVDETPGRGTWSVITSCFFTIFICTWTVIHPRVHQVRRIRRLHKPAQLVKTILAPDLVCLESLQEWIQARKMMKNTADATGGGLKLLHAFYVGMLGLRYRTAQGSRVLWPSQYTWLLNNNLVKWSDREAWGMSEQMILDKSKADGFKKITAICQVTWFVCQCITRVAHRLEVSPLETMTIAYIFIVLITYLFWWVKPKDICTATLVSLPSMAPDQLKVFESLAMENTYDDEGPATEYPNSIAWYLIGRDLEGDEINARNIASPDIEKAASHGSCSSNSTITSGDRKLVTPDTSIEEKETSTHENSEKQTHETTNVAEQANEQSLTEQPVSEQAAGEPSMVELSPISQRPTKASSTRIVVSEVEHDDSIITQWDRSLYRSKFFPLICVMGAAFGALHLMSWNSTFPTTVERWLWRSSALTAVVTSVVSMQFETVSFQWDGPWTIVRVLSPVIYVVSRFIMLGEVLAALRASPPGVYDTYVISNYWFHFV